MTLVAAAAVVLSGAAPASAATGFSSPAEGATVTEHGIVTVRADVGPLRASTSLHLRDPAGQDHTVATTGGLTGGTLSYDLQTACPSYPGQPDCTGRHPVPDGVWTAYLTGGASTERRFVVAVPPDRPATPEASAVGPTTARLRWPLGPEPDLVGYDVRTADDQPVVGDVTPDGVCSEGLCALDVDFGAAAAGRHDLVLVARRSCVGCGDEVTSAPSDPASVTLSGPTPDATSGSGAGPSAGAGTGTATPGPASPTGTAHHPAPADSMARAIDRAGLGAAPLGRLPAADDVTRIPAPRGSYRARLGYPRPRVAPPPVRRAEPAARAPVATAQPLGSRLRDAMTDVVSGGRLWPGLAAALVLAVAAAHVRRLAKGGRRQFASDRPTAR